MFFEVVFSDKVERFLSNLDQKSKNICENNLRKLKEPYPGRGIGDKEKLIVSGEESYRLHIGRTYTAFYVIDEGEKLVRILRLMSIEAAHKKYGFK